MIKIPNLLSRLYINYWNEIADIFCEMKWYFNYSSFVISSLWGMKWHHFFTRLSFHFMTRDSASPRHLSWNETQDSWRNVISLHPKWWNNSRLVMKYHFITQKMSAIVHIYNHEKNPCQINFSRHNFSVENNYN